MDQEQNKSSNGTRHHCTATGQLDDLNTHPPLYPMDEYGAIYTSGITVFRGTEDLGYPFLKQPLPEHIALIFKSVILQYAGFFKEIVFSVIDDHNTGQRLNPDGNFVPFQEVFFNKFIVYPSTTQTIGMALGPYHFVRSKGNKDSTTVEETIIGDILPCEQAANCQNLNDQDHFRSCSHPPLCPFDSECTENMDDVHCYMFIHRKECPNKGRCLVTDDHHLDNFNHPEYCSEGGHCSNIKMNHLNQYRHVPICDKGLDCDLKLKRIAAHLIQFRHCQRPCEFGGNCVLFHDQKHITNEHHPFNPPCPYTPFSCTIFNESLQSNEDQKNRNEMNETQKHCYRYSHICPWGRLCNDQTDQHLSMTIHIIRHMCPNGDKSCKYMMEEDHLDSFSHSNIRDIRLLCRSQGSECHDRSKVEHITKYRHTYVLDCLGIAQYFGLNKEINFIQNQIDMTRMIQDYVENTYKQSWKKVSVSKDLLKWIAALLPTHRCVAPIFESILEHGHVMSRFHMESLENPTFVANTVDQHKRVRKILASQVPAFQKDAHEYIEALVRIELSTSKSGSRKQQTEGNNPEALQYCIHTKEQSLKLTLEKGDIDEIRTCAREIAQASIKLHSNMTGIGHKGDIEFGTNQHIFSILGPNTAPYYGDIVIIFKRNIMLHPDSNLTMQAATMYSDKTYKCRPWVTDSGSAAGHAKQFHSTKLHCSIPGYDYITALELMAITGIQKQTMNVNLHDIVHRWKQIDAHQVMEAHLPQLIPLSYIEHIYIPKNVFEALSPGAQKNARDSFPNSLTITKHVVDLTIDHMAFSKSDDSQKEYQNYVLDQILKLIKRQEEQQAASSTSQSLTSFGMTITVPTTNFESYVTNPLTISQSYDQSNKLSRSNDSVYIYWKALRGDFMLILTNEKIETKKIQHQLVYLTCYIAPFVTNTNEDANYNEHYTYIHYCPPSSHQTVLEQQAFRGKSNTFHKGCNPSDYNLYCLKIKRQKGQISKMNAGFNGIYNHTILECTFEQNELDLTTLNYIHVSAGRQSVSIRNLIISHEPIPSAHPTFSKQPINDSSREHSQSKKKENTSNDKNIISEETDHNDDQSVLSRLSQPFKWMKKKILAKNKHQSEQDDDDESDESSQMEDLTPCKNSIYCLDQNSSEKSNSHNQIYSHPCIFSELCQNMNAVPHCIQSTHHKLDVPKCQQDMNCKQVVDPTHRCSYRHTNLSDYLYPCRSQQRCQDSSFEHRKKYFHGEKLNLIPMKNNSKDNIKPKNSYFSRLNKIKSDEKSRSTASRDTSDKNSSPIWSPDDEDSDDENLLSAFYNDAAGKSNITDASGYDQYGNPTGRNYDLGRDGAYREFSILIAQFYSDGQFNNAAMKIPIDALKVKGFQVKHVQTENECITELDSTHPKIAWIISTNRIQNPTFISTLTTFHSSGGAIFLFADNTPYVCHASQFLKMKFGITVAGDYYGGKTMTYIEKGHQQTGHFGQHEIFTGIANLFEGITICHPVYSTPASRTIFRTLATATDGNSSIAVYDPPPTSTEGRLCLDCGFTKLYVNWDSAGTARYIFNASCWLLGIEKHLKAKKNKRNKF